MKYIKTYNEKLGDKLVAPSYEEILSKLKDLSTEDIIEQSLENNFKIGIKYILDERKNELNNNKIYILEKYCLGLHQNEERDFESWFKENLTGLESFTSIKNKDIIIYKKNNIFLFNYNLKNEEFYIDYNKIWLILESKFKLNYYYVKLLTKYMVEKHLNLKGITTHTRFFEIYL